MEQRGVDVVVLLRDPTGRLLFEADNPKGTREPETVLAVTPAVGTYELEVLSFVAGAGGDFVLKVREVRLAGSHDRLRAAAAAAFARGMQRHLAGDFERAAAAWREAMPGLQALGEARRLAEAEWRLGEALTVTGELRRAAVVLERSATRFRRLGDGLGEARVQNDLGTARRQLGEPIPALAAYRRSLNLYRALGSVKGQAAVHHNLGQVYQVTGALQAAIEADEAALALWRGVGDETAASQAATLQSLGSLYGLIGHDAEALDLLEEALSLLGPDSEPGRRAAALVLLGWAETLAGRPQRALEYYAAAQAPAELAGSLIDLAGLWDRRGTALRALGRSAEAAASYTRALAFCRRSGSQACAGNTLANLGSLDLLTGAVQRGRARLRQALELLTASGDLNGEIFVRVGLSQAERRLGDLTAAREQAETAVCKVEEMRSGLQGELSRGHFLATRYDAWEELVTLLLELDRREPGRGHAREALEVAERSRARMLLERRADAPQDAQGEALRAEIRALEARRQAVAAGNPRDPRLAGLDAAMRARGLALDRRSAPPGGAEEPGGPVAEPLTSREIQDLAEDGTLLVVYLLAEPMSFAWTIDRESIEAHVLPGRGRIERLSRRAVAGLARSHQLAARTAAEQATAELSEAVLAPLAGRLAGNRRLVLLADGALHLVPFGVLPLGPTAGKNAEPLLATHEIVMVPSATALADQRRRLAGRRPAPGMVAVLADPLFLGSAPGSAQLSDPDRFEPGRFERLPYTAAEAQAIMRLVPRANRRQTLLALGPEASRELVLSGVLGRYRILHFATHGLLHPVLPERSGIVLAQVDAQGRRRDGFLSAPDVAALDLPAELVVLSACQTGLGRELRGEGLLGLTQAFFRAGARRVVVSHWNVRDRATAELMARFYHHLLTEGQPPAAALRAAQLELRADEAWSAPYYWAGFSVHGD